MFDIKGFNNLGEPKKTKKTTVTPGPTAPGSTTTDGSTNTSTDTDTDTDTDTTTKTPVEIELDALFDHDEMRTATSIFTNLVAANPKLETLLEDSISSLKAEEALRGVPKTFQNRYRHILGGMGIGISPNGMLNNMNLLQVMQLPRNEVLKIKKELDTLLQKQC